MRKITISYLTIKALGLPNEFCFAVLIIVA